MTLLMEQVPNATEKNADPPSPVVAEAPPQDNINVLANASTARKLVLMAMFTAVQFVDSCSTRRVDHFRVKALI